MKSIICVFPISGFDPSQTDIHFLYNDFHLLTDKNLAFNKEALLGRLIDQNFVNVMGLAAVNELINSSLWYLEMPIDESEPMPGLLEIGALFSDLLDQLHNCLWFIRDNNVNIKACYVRINDSEQFIENNFIVMRPIGLNHSVNKRVVDTPFTTEELYHAGEFTLRLKELTHPKSKNPSPEMPCACAKLRPLPGITGQLMP